ncbi:MAG: hypothetical protein LBS02_07740 [Hungatella sp.]|nr:hypothetical protein [Hungatella sp.]
MTANNEKELGNAIRNDENTIEVKGDLARMIVRMRSMNLVLWCICLSLLALMVTAVLAAPGTLGMSGAAAMLAGTPVAGMMGTTTTISSVMIAVAGGGVGALNKIRDYRMEQITRTHIILHRR